MRLPWLTRFAPNKQLGKLLIGRRLRIFGHCVLLPTFYLFSADFVDSHQEQQCSKGASSSPVTDRHSQQSDLSDEHQEGVEDDKDEDDSEDQRCPQNELPFKEHQNLLPHQSQCVCQTSMRPQSHSPIVMQRSCHPRSPSTCHFQSSPTQLSHHGDEISRRAQGSSHRHHNQGSSHQILLSPSPLPCKLVRQCGQ